MSEYELSPDEQRATLDRYFEPVTEAQREEIARVWREACEGSIVSSSSDRRFERSGRRGVR
jgi:hypothetical protein